MGSLPSPLMHIQVVAALSILLEFLGIDRIPVALLFCMCVGLGSRMLIMLIEIGLLRIFMGMIIVGIVIW